MSCLCRQKLDRQIATGTPPPTADQTQLTQMPKLLPKTQLLQTVKVQKKVNLKVLDFLITTTGFFFRPRQKYSRMKKLKTQGKNSKLKQKTQGFGKF